MGPQAKAYLGSVKDTFSSLRNYFVLCCKSKRLALVGLGTDTSPLALHRYIKTETHRRGKRQN